MKFKPGQEQPLAFVPPSYSSYQYCIREYFYSRSVEGESLVSVRLPTYLGSR